MEKINRDGTQRLDAWLDEYCRLNRFSGVLRVTHRDEILYQRCMGMADPNAGKPITKDSRFHFYSLSKPFCAIGFMKLWDRGMTVLDAHPSRYVKEAHGFHPDLTIAQMLRHTSGMADFSNHRDYESFKRSDCVMDIRRMVKELSEYPANFLPGTSTQYANINFAVCALIIENVSGMPYAEYMKKEVFEPLGMETASVHSHGAGIENQAIGCEIDGNRLIPVGGSLGWMFGGGDIVGSVDDVYCLNRAIKHRMLLSERAWNEILTTSPINSFGMGCAVNRWHGKPRIQHNGGHIGYRTLHIQLPQDDFDIILLSNCGFGDSRNSISEAVYTAYFGENEGRSDRVNMDAGYIDGISGASENSRGFLPAKPPAVSLVEAKEQLLLGNYGGMRLEKYGEHYRIVQNGKSLVCAYTEKGLVNCFCDECYPIAFGNDGIPTLMGIRKNT